MIEILPVPGGLAWHDPSLLGVTVFGAGLLAPFRAGLAVALAALLMIAMGRRSAIALMAMLVTLAGFFAIQAFEAATGIHDDRRIVVDEALGALLLGLILGARHRRRLLLALPVFLVLDRWKPFPFDRLEDLPGAYGVLLDDAGAGLAIGLCVLLTSRFFALYQMRANPRRWG